MDLKVRIGKLEFKNPIWVASGTFGYAQEFQDFVDFGKVGAIATKTLTLTKREGNPPPRIVETPSGMLNSIGLENQGIEHFTKEYHPFLKKLKTKIIVSIAGEKKDEILKCARILIEKALPDAIEVNLSCPNVTHKATRHQLIAQDAHSTGKILTALRKKVKCVLIAKLTPNVTDIMPIAKAVEGSGCDAVSLVNTYFGMAVDAEAMKPLLGKVIGGLSGPAIKPMALKAVRDAYKSVKIPVIGIGGIMTGIDVAEFMLSGASAVQLGTVNLVDPPAYERILGEFTEYLMRHKIRKATELTGKLKE